MRTPITATQPQPPLINNNQNARANEIPAAAQQNPFLNLLGNQHPVAGASSTVPAAPQPIPAHGATMPPPFFFPSLPFMAPYTIPPPPMPQNLEQLTVEELRAMEGNERKHVEERLKLLRNVQTMLNASAALMSQYQMVVANLPPIAVPPVVPSSVPEASLPSESTVTESSQGQDQVKLEDLGSEESVVDSSTPSTSKFTTLDNATSTFIANESLASSSMEANGDSEEANEIRKRRLQKFTQSD